MRDLDTIIRQNREAEEKYKREQAKKKEQQEEAEGRAWRERMVSETRAACYK